MITTNNSYVIYNGEIYPLAGGTNAKHILQHSMFKKFVPKYLAKIPLGGNKYRYIYTQEELAAYKMNQAKNTAESELSYRVKTNTQQNKNESALVDLDKTASSIEELSYEINKLFESDEFNVLVKEVQKKNPTLTKEDIFDLMAALVLFDELGW